ncbi:MAG: RlmE family RNA methyltransferase [Candidatus Thermoplasmatota archaeon]|nr:RlmE family RNA methyltransferase [Candidatus Thermoplasmatota archaeon]
MSEWQLAKRHDSFYRLAKQEGYRARSSFKLKQINEKFGVIHKGFAVVDLGCAPGGWMQVAKEIVGETGTVIGIDLKQIKPIEGTVFIQGDMTSDETVKKVLDAISTSGRKIDTVISDMSPNISGAYSMDHVRSIDLCEHALNFARKVLRPGGSFTAKVFEGEHFPEYFNNVKMSFDFVKRYAPDASRSSSSEIYVIAKRFRPGAKIPKSALCEKE